VLVEFPSEAAVSDAIDEPDPGSSSCQLQTHCPYQHTSHTTSTSKLSASITAKYFANATNYI